MSKRKHPVVYILVGAPGSGKTTWIKNQEWITKSYAIISTDIHVEKYAESVGKSVNEVYDDYMPTAVSLMVDDVITARKKRKNIIWEQTSLTPMSRLKKINMLKKYKKIAVVFDNLSVRELYDRTQRRTGRKVQLRIIHQMVASYVKPTLEEGFDEIWFSR